MTTVFQLADQLVDDFCVIDPILATSLGVPGSDHLWGDLGLEGIEAEHRLHVEYRPRVAAHLDAPDVAERLAAMVIVAALDERE